MARPVDSAPEPVVRESGAGMRATVSYLVLAVLQFVVLARYPHGRGLDWGAAGSWIYLGFLATVLGIGVYGWAASRGAGSEAGQPRAVQARA